MEGLYTQVAMIGTIITHFGLSRNGVQRAPTYGAQQVSPQLGPNTGIPTLAGPPAGGAAEGWPDSSRGGEGPEASAVLRD
jgi:hypothetical protein